MHLIAFRLGVRTRVEHGVGKTKHIFIRSIRAISKRDNADLDGAVAYGYVCYVSDGTMKVALLAVGGKPMGNVFDITAHGWDGATKDVVPA